MITLGVQFRLDLSPKSIFKDDPEDLEASGMTSNIDNRRYSAIQTTEVPISNTDGMF